VSIVGPAEARPADGLAVDFVVESDRAQLSEIVQRVRDGRLQTNIGNVSTLDDAVAAFRMPPTVPCCAPGARSCTLGWWRRWSGISPTSSSASRNLWRII
jgi:hypothetical protein